VKSLVHYLKEERKEVLSLGYILDKKESEKASPHLNYLFFDNNDLSPFFVPKTRELRQFMQRPFSILIDLNSQKNFPLEYISTISSAKFKVGMKGGYHDDICDLILNVDENTEMEELIKQIKHYLNMIHN